MADETKKKRTSLKVALIAAGIVVVIAAVLGLYNFVFIDRALDAKKDKIIPGMTRAEVEKEIGKPDYISPMPLTAHSNERPVGGASVPPDTSEAYVYESFHKLYLLYIYFDKDGKVIGSAIWGS